MPRIGLIGLIGLVQPFPEVGLFLGFCLGITVYLLLGGNMICTSCNNPMNFIFCWDGPNENFAYNIYHCEKCFLICRENVWERRGVVWIFSDNSTKVEIPA